MSGISENAMKVLEKRYLIKDEKGNVQETVQGMFERVSKAVASAEKTYNPNTSIEEHEKSFYNMMYNLDFLPNSPTLMNAGRPLGQLSACFVLPVEDSMEGIFESIKNAALIHKSGGGTGFSFSRLRQRGATVNSTGGVASGPISFMKVYNSATEAVKQGGTRRGANMGILRIDHPDILEFIECKSDNSEINNFNISVGITEGFMKAVESGKHYHRVDPKTGNVILPALNSREVFDKIVQMAWKNGEPGIIFLDRINKFNPTPELGEIESTNPCGEQPLLPYEACNLGSINLKNMLTKEADGINYSIDYNKLEDTVKKGVRFLDNVIDVNNYPLPEIDSMTRGTRKIGLGVMGWADMLCLMKIPYNSTEAISLAKHLMKTIQEMATRESRELAVERDVFPYWEKSIFAKTNIKIRNATTTTIAPTGTLSMIAGVSSGIEPLFALSYIRNIMDNVEMVEVNPIFEQVAKERGFYSEDLMKKIAEVGTIQGMEEIPTDVREVFVTSHDISPEYHVKMQSAFQGSVENAVSKTVNLSHSATKEDVAEVYWLAYRTGCKGVTIYRDGSREMQVLNVKEVKGKEPVNEPKKPSVYEPKERPEILTGLTEKVKIGCGNLYVTVNGDSDGICEIFSSTGRSGGCPSQTEATSRLISIALRAGIDSKYIIEQLKGIRCPSTTRKGNSKVLSCPDAIGKTMEKWVSMKTDNVINTTAFEPTIKPTEEKTKTCSLVNPDAIVDGKCPECKTKLEFGGGCVSCKSCGWGKCG